MAGCSTAEHCGLKIYCRWSLLLLVQCLGASDFMGDSINAVLSPLDYAHSSPLLFITSINIQPYLPVCFLYRGVRPRPEDLPTIGDLDHQCRHHQDAGFGYALRAVSGKHYFP